MKTVGLLGGMSWESTVLYYETINRFVAQRLGGLHSAEVLLASVDFALVERLQSMDRWDQAGELLADRGRALEGAGADLLVLCTNTMHKVASRIEAAVGIPLLHIADATGAEAEAAGVRRVGLIGTRFTMEESFYADRLREAFGLEVMIPQMSDRREIDRVIYQELCLGILRPSSRQAYGQVIEDLVARGSEAVILGCTEIGLLVAPADVPVPVFDTARIHARRAAQLALDGGPS